MNQEVKKWLENPERNYSVGVELYRRYGKNKLLLSNFQKKETKRNQEKIAYELGKISDFMPSEVRISAEKQNEINSFVKNVLSSEPVKESNPVPEIDKDEPTTFPDPISVLENLAASLFNQRAKISNQLGSRNLNDAGRKQVLEELDAVESKYYATQQKIHDFKKTGQINDDPVSKSKRPDKFIIPANEADRVRALSNARSRRIKAKKKKDQHAPGTPKYNKFAAEEQKEEKFIKQLEGIIK